MRENWVKYPVSLGVDLKSGKLTRDEFLLVSYMLSVCDRETGIIVTNSRLLSIETDQDRKRVSNVLSALKKKGRVQNPDGAALPLRQKRGCTKPFAVLLCDALPNGILDRNKTELRQRQDRAKTLELDREKAGVAPEHAETLSKTENGKILAKRDLDLDLEGDKDNYDHDVAPPPENADAERQDMICDALKKAIGGHPNSITLVSNSYQLEAFNALMEYPDEKILHVIQSSGEKGKLHQDNAITYTKNGLDHWDAWYAGKAGGNGGATGSIGDIRRAKEAANLALMKEELVELEAKTDGDWSEHILAMQVAIAEAEVG